MDSATKVTDRTANENAPQKTETQKTTPIKLQKNAAQVYVQRSFFYSNKCS